MRSIFSLAALMFSFILFAQDIIVTIEDKVIEAKVLEVAEGKISYKRFDYLNGPTLTINLENVKELVYANGQKEDLDNFKSKKRLSGNSLRDADYYIKGLEDGSQYYSATGPTIGSTASTILFWPAGLVTSIVLSSTKPKSASNRRANQDYIANPSYNKGYIEQAHRKKKRSVWTGFGVGTGFLIILGLAAAGA